MSICRNLKRALPASVLALVANCQANTIDPNFCPYTSNGGFDRLFWYGKDLYALTATIDANGNIYVVGNLSDGTGASFVYSQNSSGIDRVYGDKLPVALNDTFDGLTNYATTAVVDAEGRVLIGGYVTLPLDTCPDGSANTSYAFVTRFDTHGAMDTSFGLSGPFAGSSFIRLPCSYPFHTEIGIQSNGKIVVASSAWPNDRSSAYVLVGRLSSDGSIDGAFGSAGLVTLNTAATDEDLILTGFSLARSDAIAVAGGRRSRLTDETTADIFKLTVNGEIDAAFGKNGIYHFDPVNPASLSSIGFNSSNQLYFAATDANDGDFSVTKLKSDGTLDNSFGTNGNSKFSFGSYRSAPYKLLFDARDRLDVAGFAQDWMYDLGTLFLLHLNADGTVNEALGPQRDYEQSCGLFNCDLRGALIDHQNRPTLVTYSNGLTILFRYDELFGAGFD